MLVSNFEVGGDTRRGPSGATRYRLTVTNLEDVPVEFAATAAIGASERPVWVERLNCRWNTGRLGRTIWHRGTVSTTASTLIGPASTDWFEAWLDDGNAWINVAGHVELRVPPARRAGRYTLEPQSGHSVRVLLDAKLHHHRRGGPAGITDHDGRVLYHTHVGDDRSAAAIAISTGKAENEIAGDGWTVDGVPLFLDALRTGTLDWTTVEGARQLDSNDLVPALVDLLVGLGDEREELDALNEVLAETGASVRLRHD